MYSAAQCRLCTACHTMSTMPMAFYTSTDLYCQQQYNAHTGVIP
jgi:hypothetical protein